MKTRWLSMMGLGLAVACLCLAPQTQAAKGGVPGKPGGEDPPPPPPISYQRVEINYDYGLFSINDLGVVAGAHYVTELSTHAEAFSLVPDITGEIPAYHSSEAVTLCDFIAFPAIPDAVPAGNGLWINNRNQVIGGYRVKDESRFDWCAVLWLEDGTQIDLGVAPAGTSSKTFAINDVGLVVVINVSTGAGSVIVPEDINGDEVADTWFVDNDNDGVNDLLYPLGTSLRPYAINEYGQIVFAEGYLLTPDYADADWDGNPWFADVDEDGVNDLLYVLSAEAEGVAAYDINDLGQIVGSADGRAVMWEVVGGVETIVDLGQLSKHTSDLVAYGINNAGQIFGNCSEKRERLLFFYHEGEMYRFSDLTIDGSNPSSLMDINNNGWIVSGGAAVYIPVEQP